jgi:hypothetical protein
MDLPAAPPMDFGPQGHLGRRVPSPQTIVRSHWRCGLRSNRSCGDYLSDRAAAIASWIPGAATSTSRPRSE